MTERERFDGFEVVLPPGATVERPGPVADEVGRVTHRVDIDVSGERITVLATWRRGLVAAHVGWLRILEEHHTTAVQAIEGWERFPFERRGTLDRTVFVRTGLSALGKYGACNADWVHDVFVELDEEGRPSPAASAVLDSFVPEPQEELPVLDGLEFSNDHLPTAVHLERGGVVEFAGLVPSGLCFDLVDLAHPADSDPGFAETGAGVWGVSSHLRFATLGARPTVVRVRWAGTQVAALANAADWEHVADAALACTSDRVLIVPDVGDLDHAVSITLPVSDDVGVVYRFRGVLDPVEPDELQGEYEILLYQPPAVREPTTVVDSGLFSG